MWWKKNALPPVGGGGGEAQPPEPGPHCWIGARTGSGSGPPLRPGPGAHRQGLGPGPVVLAGVGGAAADRRRVRQRAESPILHTGREGVTSSRRRTHEFAGDELVGARVQLGPADRGRVFAVDRPGS